MTSDTRRSRRGLLFFVGEFSYSAQGSDSGRFKVLKTKGIW